MKKLIQYNGLYVDFYELAMAQGYFLDGRSGTSVVFDYSFRSNPFNGGYVVFAGLGDLIMQLAEFRFTDEDVHYLMKLGFEERFARYLLDFRFSADIHAVREGEIVFPYEPVLRVAGSIIEAQMIETLLLNTLNFESLIATKAARIRQAAGPDRLLMDFGLRRAQGLGGIQASKAAIMGGFNITSNVYAAMRYDLASTGTMAHSWVQSFSDEYKAFEAFAEIYPDHCIVLVDTYDTLNSGIPNAIRLGKSLKKKKRSLQAVRLDSGDLAYLSKEARRRLDDAGLTEVKIVASNQLDEQIIQSLLQEGAPIDAFGVGTSLVTGMDSGALDGVYKLSLIDGAPVMKLAENIQKSSLPGRKNIYRYHGDQHKFRADAIVLEGEAEPDTIYHPMDPEKSASLSGCVAAQLLQPVMLGGQAQIRPGSAYEIAEHVRQGLDQLPAEHKRFLNPHPYQVGLSLQMKGLREEIATGLKHQNR